MRGCRPGYVATPELANPAEERAKDRRVRIPVYAQRARAGLPLFDEPVHVAVRIAEARKLARARGRVASRLNAAPPGKLRRSPTSSARSQ